MGTVSQYFVLLNMAIFSHGCCPTEYNLVTGANGVEDDALSASSAIENCPIEGVRYSNAAGWCPNTTESGHFVQVEFKSVSLLNAVQTRGRENQNQWVTSYSVNISMDGLNWTSVLDSTGKVKVFPGNSDRSSVVTNVLGGTVITKYIRIISVTVHNRGSMRLEVQGCPYSEVKGTCWGAKLGSTGDVLPVLLSANASNPGICGITCHRQPKCDSFLFDVTSARCRLLSTTVTDVQDTVDLDGVWYFVKK